jgi:hypothetical protein
MKIYRVGVLGWNGIEYVGIFSSEQTAKNDYSEKIKNELDKEENSKKDGGFPYLKNGVDLVEMIENDNGKFIYNQTLLNFEGDYS